MAASKKCWWMPSRSVARWPPPAGGGPQGASDSGSSASASAAISGTARLRPLIARASSAARVRRPWRAPSWRARASVKAARVAANSGSISSRISRRGSNTACGTGTSRRTRSPRLVSRGASGAASASAASSCSLGIGAASSSNPPGKKSLRRLSSSSTCAGNRPKGGRRAKSAPRLAGGGGGSPAAAICSASCSICACHSAGRRQCVARPPAPPPMRGQRARPPARTTLARSRKSGVQSAAQATRPSATPHGAQGSCACSPRLRSASKMRQAIRLRQRPAPAGGSGGRLRHSSGQAYQSRRAASPLRQSSKAAPPSPEQASSGQGSVGSNSLMRSLATGCSTRMPTRGRAAGAAATTSPSAGPTILPASTAAPPPPAPPRPEKAEGSATTGRLPSSNSWARATCTSSPLAPRPFPCISAMRLPPRPLPTSASAVSSPCTTPAVKARPRRATWAVAQSWRPDSVGPVSVRPANRLGRRSHQRAASAASSGARARMRSPGSACRIGRMLTIHLQASGAAAGRLAPAWRGLGGRGGRRRWGRGRGRRRGCGAAPAPA